MNLKSPTKNHIEKRTKAPWFSRKGSSSPKGQPEHNTDRSEPDMAKTTEKSSSKAALEQENQKWRDGSHPDLPKTLRTIREQRVQEDRCVICLGGGSEDPIHLFSACCGQAYHANCYLKQLAWAKHSSSNSNHDKCGVCRKLLPKTCGTITLINCLMALSSSKSVY